MIAAVGSGGQRFAVLASELGVARQTLRRALDAAIERGLVAPNPGYGHPLRPEYLLTPVGRRLEGPCRDLVGLAERLAPDLAGRKWTLPVLAAVHGGAERFTDLAVVLGSVTPRALSRALDDLVDAGLLVRTVGDAWSARTRYRVSEEAAPLAACASELAEVARLVIPA